MSQEKHILKEIDSSKITKLISDEDENLDLSNKIRSALMAFEHNTESVHISNGKIPHALMLQLFTDDSVGTIITRK